MRVHLQALRALAFGVMLVAPGAVLAQAKLHDIYSYKGPDREQRLIEGAKQEGTVVIYTSMNTKDSAPITEAFEKKYGIKVSLWRGGSEDVVKRALTEVSSGRYSPDVFELNGPDMEILYREKLLTEFWSPAFKDLPRGAFPPHRHYVADRFNFFVMGYNTDLVKPDEVPNSYEDLLAPRWTGQFAIEEGDVDWFGAVVKGMGEEKGLAYFRKLAEMRPQMGKGHTTLAKAVAAGEVPLLLTGYNHSLQKQVDKGAPVGWKPLPPTFGRPGAVGVAANAPHPHAALLFADFLLSREGQELIKKRGRVPSSRVVNSPLNNFEYDSIDPAVVLEEAKKWEALWAGLFLKGAGTAQ